ncbi:MAG: replication protein RepA [Rhodospirillaceae bacterium]
MSEIHDLVTRVGREQARQMVTDPDDRRLIDKVHNFLSDEKGGIGVTYSGFCMISLPHRALENPNDKWHRNLGPMSLTVDPGNLFIDGRDVLYGVPYGSRARLILLYLQTRALRKNCREVELGSSMYDWLQRMGIAIGGRSYREVKEQAARISACSLRFSWEGETGNGKRYSGFKKDSIVEGGIVFHNNVPDPRQPSLWEDTVVISQTFFDALRKHPVPIWEPAIRQISNQSMAIDAYVWLAYRLRALTRPKLIPWPDVQNQFGPQFSRLRKFRESFLQVLKNVLTVYPEAKIEATDEGVMLYPSPPAVPERTMVQVLLPRGL